MKSNNQIIISENKKRRTKMVVTHHIVKGKKNRVGNPYIISETKHLKRWTMDEYKPTIKVVVNKLNDPTCDKHEFNCEVIHSDSTRNYLRFIYVSHYKNLSKPNKYGEVIRDISTAAKGYDTSFNTEHWNVDISLSERKV